MRTTRVITLAAASVLALGALAACSDGDGGGDSTTGGPVAVNASDTACEVAVTELPAGTVVFTVANRGTKVTEFYVYAAGDRVMGEVENVAPGLSRELRVELPAGAYQTACKPGMAGNGIRGALTVTGSAAPLTAAAALAAATDNYQRYVSSWPGTTG